MKIKHLLLALLTLFVSCNSDQKQEEADLSNLPWDEIVKQGEGKTVHFMMWQGSPVINSYIRNYVVPMVREKYNINLQITGGQGPEIVQLVMSEKEAGVEVGQVDMCWINGETFFQLNQIKGLYGPFVKQLPNSEFIDFDNPFISSDFQQHFNYMECPWSISQFAMVYDSAKVQNPPTSLTELADYVKKNPGTFTISNDFSGMTLLKGFLAELGGGKESLNGPFDEEKYKLLSTKLWEFINQNKKYFWKNGETFPNEHSQMNQLFSLGELNLIYGFGEGGFEDKVKSGLFPVSTRGYGWKSGMIKNSNYLGILHNAPEKAAAMLVINFLISPEAQFAKSNADEMDSNTIISYEKLPDEWKKKFDEAPKRKYAPTMEDLSQFAMAEPAPEYMIRLFEDFRSQVIEK